MLIADLPIYEGANYAPLRPLIELDERSLTAGQDSPEGDLCDQLKNLFNELDKQNEVFFEALSETAYISAATVQGRSQWEFDFYRGGLLTLRASDPKANPNRPQSFNKAQFQISRILESLSSSNPDFEPADMFKNWRHEEQVRKVKALVNHYEPLFWNHHFNLEQANSLLMTGMAIEELVFNASAKKVPVYAEKWGVARVPVSEDGGMCFECGLEAPSEAFSGGGSPEIAEIGAAAREGDQEAIELMGMEPQLFAPQCPQCGSFNVETYEAEEAEVPSIEGFERFDVGDFELHDLPAQRCRFDITVRPEDSSYFIDKQYFPSGKIKYVLGKDLDLPPASEDTCLEYLRRMASISPALYQERQHSYDVDLRRNTTLFKMSIGPEHTSQIMVPKGTGKSVSGEKLKEGKTLADCFEDGKCTIVGFGNGDVIYGIYGSGHGERISTSVFLSRPNSGAGRGIEDMVEIQKRYSRLDQQHLAAVDAANPGYLFVEGSIDENHLRRMHHPSARTPVRFDLVRQLGDISRVARQMQPAQVSPQLFSYAAELEKMMQMTAHNITMSGSVFDARNDTATGARILEAAAQAIMIPILQSKAEMRRGTIKNLLRQYPKVFSEISRDYALKTGKNSFSGVSLKGDEIDPDIDLVIVANSQIPQNFYLRKVDYLGFLNAVAEAGGYQQLKETDPAMLQQIAGIFAVDIGDDAQSSVERICRKRLQDAVAKAPMIIAMIEEEAMQQEMAGGMQPESLDPEGGEQEIAPDPMMMALMAIVGSVEPPIRPEEASHQAKSEWFRDFVESEEAEDMQAFERDICYAFVRAHKEAAMQLMAADQMLMGMDGLVGDAGGQALMAKGQQIVAEGMMPPPGAEPDRLTKGSAADGPPALSLVS